MKYLLLCEGETDAILLSYLMINTYGWSYLEKKNYKTNDIIELNLVNHNQSSNWYIKGDNQLLICAVGGCDNYNNFLDEYILPIQKTNIEAYFNKMIIVVDRDDKDVSEIEKSINDVIKIKTSFKNNKWITNTYVNDYNVSRQFDEFLLIVPSNSSGAIENVVLDAISNISLEYNLIVEKSKNFIDELSQDDIETLKRRRFILKAKMGVVFAIISPMKVFSDLDSLLRSIDFSNNSFAISTFNVLSQL